jgi:putative methionine-R-sulfoxide reductase with GAF domain
VTGGETDFLRDVSEMLVGPDPVETKLAWLLNQARARLGSGRSEPPNARPGTDGNFTVGTFFMVTSDRQELAIFLPQNFPPEQANLRIPAGHGHPGRVAMTGEALLLEDTRQHQFFVQILNTARMGSAMFSPLRWRGEVCGVMVHAAIQPGTYTPADFRLHGVLANLAALLIRLPAEG